MLSTNRKAAMMKPAVSDQLSADSYGNGLL